MELVQRAFASADEFEAWLEREGSSSPGVWLRFAKKGSGVASVSNAYYDVARTLGAKPSFLVLKVAIPAALPHVLGLGSSFAVLVVAEMIGVKAGLGWYLQWAQGWAAYANMYAALLVMAFLCSGLITLLFRVRDRLLSWQKGLVRW